MLVHAMTERGNVALEMVFTGDEFVGTYVEAFDRDRNRAIEALSALAASSQERGFSSLNMGTLTHRRTRLTAP